MNRADILKRRERELIGHMRETLVHLDSDTSIASQHGYEVDFLFRAHFLEWSEDFCKLYNDMQVIYRSYTPHKKGRYRYSSVEVGYSSFQVSKWVDDKEQPPRPTSLELVARFDALLDTWNTKGENAHE